MSFTTLLPLVLDETSISQEEPRRILIKDEFEKAKEQPEKRLEPPFGGVAVGGDSSFVQRQHTDEKVLRASDSHGPVYKPQDLLLI